MPILLSVDCLNEIFEKLEEDKITLHSCLLVSRLWCKISIRFFILYAESVRPQPVPERDCQIKLFTLTVVNSGVVMEICVSNRRLRMIVIPVVR